MSESDKKMSVVKKPVSSYILFCQEKRGEFKNKNTEKKLNNKELTLQIAELWRGLTEDQKAPYTERARVAREAYKNSVATTVPAPKPKREKKTAKTKPEVVATSVPVPAPKPKREKKAKTGPKRLSGYNLYCKETFALAKTDGKTFTEVSKVVSSKWKGLSDADKKVWNDRAKSLVGEDQLVDE